MNHAAPHAPRSLSALLDGIVPLPLAHERLLSGLSLDSRRVAAGDLFLACKGAQRDGRDFIDDAIGRGAVAVLAEADAPLDGATRNGKSLRRDVPIIAVPQLPRQMAVVAARFFALPAQQLRLIGITGTNGKTTRCQLAARLFTALGRRAGVIGTLGYGLSGSELCQEDNIPGTTPDAVSLQRQLAELVQAGAAVVVMEVSSHGLAQHRVVVDDYAAALFTNLTRDHLDLHGTMDAYGACKRQLFTGTGLELAVLNWDDAYVRATAALLRKELRTLTWSLSDRRADLHASELRFSPAGLMLRVATPWGEFPLHTPLLGAFNASNLLGVLALVLGELAGEADFDPAAVIAAAATLPPVPGRMEIVPSEAPLTVVVDYAHTPDALEQALQALREHCVGKLWCVFGCGGERDRGKRPLMAASAEARADQLVLTDDNPRHETSQQILADMLEGLRFPARAKVQADRARAIAFAIENAAPGDAILIAGKGHETYQDSNGVKLPFNDVTEASAVLDRLCRKSGGRA
ncbi:MAG: UDP-N-acetylmuramoyl-L-alanyl-D-glutamate--2,6-diaminopimelate ligase [Pseudomonadales bacterium]|jgi:UDP-N-acetylmuramoyl-L-alanyl-D-glutamate--2,6-diaminopimelate ligase|nr:UDP-N-acetylmuramoyl-L-alanyl-D-glutamate--2,6-diaminopimelate ligase [Pseudomonadales bacterium]